MRMRLRRRASFHSTMICSPKKRVNCDMQPAGWVICRKKGVCSKRGGGRHRKHDSPRIADLHLRVHAVVDGTSPHAGRECHGITSIRGQHRSLVLIKSLQGGVVTRGLELEPEGRRMKP